MCVCVVLNQVCDYFVLGPVLFEMMNWEVFKVVAIRPRRYDPSIKWGWWCWMKTLAGLLLSLPSPIFVDDLQKISKNFIQSTLRQCGMSQLLFQVWVICGGMFPWHSSTGRSTRFKTHSFHFYLSLGPHHFRFLSKLSLGCWYLAHFNTQQQHSFCLTFRSPWHWCWPKLVHQSRCFTSHTLINQDFRCILAKYGWAKAWSSTS